MRARPLIVFMTVASAAVCWFALRMAGSGSFAVWRASCFVGAWAPLAAAGMFLYVAREGHREDSVLAAWLVRAIGMHCVLAWLLGLSDWLRGPPGSPQMRNADALVPLLLLSFVPAFALGVGVLRGLGRARRLLAERAPPPTRTVALDAATIPYRGADRLRVTVDAPRFPAAPLAAALVGAVCVWAACVAPLPPAYVLAGAAALLALASTRGPAAVAPSAVSLVAVSAALVARDLPSLAAPRSVVNHVFAWPWVAVAGVALYLGALRVLLPRRQRALA